jgi:uncharacterized protein
MNISGSYTLRAPREQVWDALLDPNTIRQAVPGCESLEQTGDNQYAMRLNVGVAGVKGVYNGDLRVLDAQKPETYRVVIDGTGARGILHGGGVVRLEASDASTTIVHYTGQAQLGGALASLGMQVASGAANMLIKQYFVRLTNLLPAAPIAPAAAAVAAAPMASETSTAAATAEPAAPTEPAPPEPEVAFVPEALPAEPVASPIADTALAETPATSEPAPVEAFMPPPTAPIIAPQPPAPPVTPPTSTAPPPADMLSSAPPQPPVMATPRQTRMSNGATGSEQSTARTLGVIVAIVAIVIVAIIVLIVIGPFR